MREEIERQHRLIRTMEWQPGMLWYEATQTTLARLRALVDAHPYAHEEDAAQELLL